MRTTIIKKDGTVASQKRSWTIATGGLDRACDELFDELINRWRGGIAVGSASVSAVDCGDHYEVHIVANVSDPDAVEVEVTDLSLHVRVPPGALPRSEHSINFARPVERERTTARWAQGVLTVTLPKQKGRRVKIE
jgi:HSP20 family molecular chaperone IbpA